MIVAWGIFSNQGISRAWEGTACKVNTFPTYPRLFIEISTARSRSRMQVSQNAFQVPFYDIPCKRRVLRLRTLKRMYRLQHAQFESLAQDKHTTVVSNSAAGSAPDSLAIEEFEDILWADVKANRAPPKRTTEYYEYLIASTS